jgi:hypothetical protein
VSSYYKLRRKGKKLPGGHEKLAKELGTLEVFKLSKVVGELHRFLQGVQKGFENGPSPEGRICAKCTKESRTCRSPKDVELIHHRGEDKWQNCKNFRSRSFGRFVERKH